MKIKNQFDEQKFINEMNARLNGHNHQGGTFLASVANAAFDLANVILLPLCFIVGAIWCVFSLVGSIAIERESAQWFYGTGKYAKK